MPKAKPITITPEMQTVLNRWKYFATRNNLVFAPWTDINFKARVVVEYHGACPCKRDERRLCPCPECLPEVKSNGQCFCHVFTTQEYVNKHT